jgi:hypothetical protein
MKETIQFVETKRPDDDDEEEEEDSFFSMKMNIEANPVSAKPV